MSNETEQLRDELDALKREHIEFADRVRRDTATAMMVLSMLVGPMDRLAVAMAELCTVAANIVQQHKMQQERAGGYDLAALKVHADTPSNSEAPFENE